MNEPQSLSPEPHNPSPEFSPESDAGSTHDPFAAPVAVDVEPEPEAAPEEPEPEAPAEDPIGTAAAIVAAVSGSCTLWAYPMDPAEHEALHRDLVPVLRKHDVPELLPPEEAQLAKTAGGIIFPRVIARWRSRHQEESDDDSVGTGEEGEWEDSIDSEAGGQEVAPSAEADSLLARP